MKELKVPFIILGVSLVLIVAVALVSGTNSNETSDFKTLIAYKPKNSFDYL